MNMQNLVSKESLGVKFKDSIYTGLCLKLWFESNWDFCNFTELWWFWKGLSRNKVPNSHFVESIWKSNIAVFWTVISNKMIMYHFPNTRFDYFVIINITYLYGKLFTKSLAQAATKNTKFMFTKTSRLLFS